MRFPIVFLLLIARAAAGATFGTVVPVTGEAADLALDEARGRLYILNSTESRVDIYSIAQRQITGSMPTGATPLAAAMSPDGKWLYVTSYGASALEVFDLDQQAEVNRISLASAPEGVAVGRGGIVLISTTGAGANNSLFVYDPSQSGSLMPVASTLPPPAAPQIAPPPTNVYIASRSRLIPTADGSLIIGLLNPTTTTRLVFVFEVASTSVLRSRQVTSISSVLSVSPDGSKFMAGLSLFDTATLAILGQQNTANSAYPFPSNANFNTQQVQGGSVFAPDGSKLYSAFNITPVQNPPAAPNSSQLMLSDPDNLLINLGLQLPENVTGKMVVSADGRTIYALSQSGVLALPVSAIYNSPIAMPDNNVLLLANDQCGTTASLQSGQVHVANAGKGQMTVIAQVNQTGPTFTFPLGNAGGGTGGVPTFPGAGGGAPGGGIVIIFPNPGGGAAGAGGATIPPGNFPGGGAGAGAAARTATQQNAVTATAPQAKVTENGTDATIQFTYNSAAATSLGTIVPTDFLLQSPQAINIPPRIRVYQNNRNAEIDGNTMAVPISISTAEALVDMVQDTARQRLYIANAGMNRVEIFDTANQVFLGPIKVGQLPGSLALSPDGNTLYVANTGGESISIVDLNQGAVTGRVQFPPVPYNASFALVTPSVIAATLSGLQIVMSNGQVWHVVNNEAMPRAAGPVLGSTTITSPFNLVATPGGEFALLLAGNGTAYLFDASADAYVSSQTVQSTPIQGYYGAVAAGPRGQYYVVNGSLLNSSLTPISVSPPVPGANGTSVPRPISAVAAVSANQFARFVQPTRTSASAAVTTAPTVEVADAATGAVRLAGIPVPEGPLSTQAGTQRVNLGGKLMAVDPSGNYAYLITASGLTVVPLTTVPPASRPTLTGSGMVNSASMQAAVAAGSVVDIFGKNLATTDQAGTTSPLPTILGGACVTMNNVPLPLIATSPGQINAQLPPNMTAGKYSLVVRSLDLNVATAPSTVTTTKVAPAVYTLDSGYAAVYHKDGTPVDSANPASRDEPLVMYASGLGPTTGGKVTAGMPSPSDPLAVTAAVQVYFGDPSMSQSAVIVDWSGLSPGMIGVYQLNLRIPGNHTKGDPLPVMIKVDGTSSPTTGSDVPKIAVN